VLCETLPHSNLRKTTRIEFGNFRAPSPAQPRRMKKGEMAATEGCILREWQKNCIPAVNEAAALQFVRVLLGLLSPSTPSPPVAPGNAEQRRLGQALRVGFPRRQSARLSFGSP
jgi:hypothetical protein